MIPIVISDLKLLMQKNMEKHFYFIKKYCEVKEQINEINDFTYS